MGGEMIILPGLMAIALGAAQLAAAPQPAPPAANGPQPSSTTTVVPVNGFDLGAKPANALTRNQAEALQSQCDDRRFETSADGMIDGAMKRRKISLCAAPGESNIQWITKLENAVAWVRAQPGLSDPVKAKLVADLRTRIGQERSVVSLRAMPSAGLSAADALVATVPPMPPPLPPQSLSASSLLASPSQARVPLTIRCLGAGERGEGGRCDRLDPDTVFAVRADANLARPAVLRFLRRGETRAEIPVTALRQGQVIRVKLPLEVCSRVTASVVTIEVLAGGPATALGTRMSEELGPFRLRC
jgi:hypothetical protein